MDVKDKSGNKVSGRSVLDMVMDVYQGLTGQNRSGARTEAPVDDKRPEPLAIRGILFVDDTGVLASLADSVMRTICEEIDVSFTSECARLQEEAAPLPMQLLYAASEMRIKCLKYPPPLLDESLLRPEIGVLCMTTSQAQKISHNYREFQRNVQCLFRRELPVPQDPDGWKNTADILRSAVKSLADSLFEGA